MLSAIRAQAAAPKQPVPVFTLPKHPDGVLPSGNTGLAMDSAVGAVQSWANGFALSGYFSEGITFLGYAYLSELAQRPEYRVISETIATEMTRKWIRFTSNDGEDKADKIAELEAEFKRLNVRDIFCRAAEQDGFFGRGHIYIDTGDTDDADELQKPIGDGWDKLSVTKFSKKPIKALRTVEAVWCYPTNYNSSDPLKDNWYRPDSWYVQAKIVHTTRLITLIGREVPDLLKPTYSFGGLSLSQMCKPYVDNWLETRQSVNDIISMFSVFLLATNLGETLQADGDQLFRRAELFNLVRSNRGLMMIDKDSEDFKNVAAPLSGLDVLQAPGAGAHGVGEPHSAGQAARRPAGRFERLLRGRNPGLLRLRPLLPGAPVSPADTSPAWPGDDIALGRARSRHRLRVRKARRDQ